MDTLSGHRFILIQRPICVFFLLLLFRLSAMPTEQPTSCEPGTWGKDCGQTCNCLNASEACHVSGKCVSGCAPGYSGKDCTLTLKELYPYFIADGCFLMVMIVIIVASCYFICRKKTPTKSKIFLGSSCIQDIPARQGSSPRKDKKGELGHQESETSSIFDYDKDPPKLSSSSDNSDSVNIIWNENFDEEYKPRDERDFTEGSTQKTNLTIHDRNQRDDMNGDRRADILGKDSSNVFTLAGGECSYPGAQKLTNVIRSSSIGSTKTMSDTAPRSELIHSLGQTSLDFQLLSETSKQETYTNRKTLSFEHLNNNQKMKSGFSETSSDSDFAQTSSCRELSTRFDHETGQSEKTEELLNSGKHKFSNPMTLNVESPVFWQPSEIECIYENAVLPLDEPESIQTIVCQSLHKTEQPVEVTRKPHDERENPFTEFDEVSEGKSSRSQIESQPSLMSDILGTSSVSFTAENDKIIDHGPESDEVLLDPPKLVTKLDEIFIAKEDGFGDVYGGKPKLTAQLKLNPENHFQAASYKEQAATEPSGIRPTATSSRSWPHIKKAHSLRYGSCQPISSSSLGAFLLPSNHEQCFANLFDVLSENAEATAKEIHQTIKHPVIPLTGMYSEYPVQPLENSVSDVETVTENINEEFLFAKSCLKKICPHKCGLNEDRILKKMLIKERQRRPTLPSRQRDTGVPVEEIGDKIPIQCTEKVLSLSPDSNERKPTISSHKSVEIVDYPGEGQMGSAIEQSMSETLTTDVGEQAKNPSFSSTEMVFKIGQNSAEKQTYSYTSAMGICDQKSQAQEHGDWSHASSATCFNTQRTHADKLGNDWSSCHSLDNRTHITGDEKESERCSNSAIAGLGIEQNMTQEDEDNSHLLYSCRCDNEFENELNTQQGQKQKACDISHSSGPVIGLLDPQDHSDKQRDGSSKRDPASMNRAQTPVLKQMNRFHSCPDIPLQAYEEECGSSSQPSSPVSKPRSHRCGTYRHGDTYPGNPSMTFVNQRSQSHLRSQRKPGHSHLPFNTLYQPSDGPWKQPKPHKCDMVSSLEVSSWSPQKSQGILVSPSRQPWISPGALIRPFLSPGRATSIQLKSPGALPRPSVSPVKATRSPSKSPDTSRRPSLSPVRVTNNPPRSPDTSMRPLLNPVKSQEALDGTTVSRVGQTSSTRWSPGTSVKLPTSPMRSHLNPLKSTGTVSQDSKIPVLIPRRSKKASSSPERVQSQPPSPTWSGQLPKSRKPWR